jgi:hypothetical protein
MEVSSTDLNLGCRWCGEIHKPAASGQDKTESIWELELSFALLEREEFLTEHRFFGRLIPYIHLDAK